MVVQKSGGPWYVCIDCNHMFALPLWLKLFKKARELPRCPKCGGKNIAIPHF